MAKTIDDERLRTFSRYFRDYANQYVIIGGVACYLNLGELRLPFRPTRDVDIILIVEGLTAEFFVAFRSFIRDGGYESQKRISGPVHKYRFSNPSDIRFPVMVELFSRNDKTVEFDAGNRMVVVDPDDISDLSAIILDDEYYRLATTGIKHQEGLSYLDPVRIILLKAKAYLNHLLEWQSGRLSIDKEPDIWKHADDIVRLAQIVEPTERILISTSIMTDFQNAQRSILSFDPAFDLRLTRDAYRSAFDLLSKIYHS